MALQARPCEQGAGGGRGDPGCRGRSVLATTQDRHTRAVLAACRPRRRLRLGRLSPRPESGRGSRWGMGGFTWPGCRPPRGSIVRQHGTDRWAKVKCLLLTPISVDHPDQVRGGGCKLLRYVLKSDQGSADHGINAAGHLLPHGDRRVDKGDRTATPSLAGIIGRPGRADNVGKHDCVVARPTLALRLVEVLFHLRLAQVLAGCQSKAGRDLLFGWLLLRLQVIHGYPDALVTYVVRVLGDERVHVAPAQVLDLGR